MKTQKYDVWWVTSTKSKIEKASLKKEDAISLARSLVRKNTGTSIVKRTGSYMPLITFKS